MTAIVVLVRNASEDLSEISTVAKFYFLTFTENYFVILKMLSIHSYNYRFIKTIRLSNRNRCTNKPKTISRKIFAQETKGQQQPKKLTDEQQKELIEQQNLAKLRSVDMLTRLLKAKDIQKEADELVEHMDPNFFHIAGTYIEMAKKEGDQNTLGNLTRVYEAAQKARNKTLRPEIQLLNELLWAKKKSWETLLNNNAEVLGLDNEYFFELADQLIKDFDQQKNFIQSNKIREIKKKARAVRNNQSS
eukprot:TRINITY_DN7347_c2_g1_i1.p1 TRINITY_DN7347_c2_g1~~TRINITY_DN7347_c2_g1_i1.p1  ORF type:complete len:247 (+),score=28.39 TRINITY_DN7347_c2_g1_i1:1-741(+)